VTWDETIAWLLLAGGGFVAGGLGGLLGIGGGIVLMPLLRFGIGLSPPYAAGTCILGVFFTTLGGSYRHYRLGHVRVRAVAPVIVAGAVATLVCSLLFVYLAHSERWLDLGIGLVFGLVSLRMLLESLCGPGEPAALSTTATVSSATPAGAASSVAPGAGSSELHMVGGWPRKLSIGISAGILPGLLGIGTGGILVPAFTYLLRMPIKLAMAASLTCFCFNALISATAKLAQGYVDLAVALPICAGALVGANVGAVLNRRFPSRTVKLLFGLLFTYVSLKFIVSYFGVKA
jgi:uncharacterized membrane protein YfcA